MAHTKTPVNISMKQAVRTELARIALQNGMSMSAAASLLVNAEGYRQCAHFDSTGEKRIVPMAYPTVEKRLPFCLAFTEKVHHRLRTLAKLHGYTIAGMFEAIIADELRRENAYFERTGGKLRL